ADAAGGPRCDHVAGLEPRERRAVLDQGGHVEAELGDALVLHDLAVKSCRQAELRRVGPLVGRDEPGSERAARDKVLAGGPLWPMTLEVADAAVVEACVARDVLERALAGHAAGRAA